MPQRRRDAERPRFADARLRRAERSDDRSAEM